MLKKMTAVILALVLGLISCQAFALKTQKDDNAVEPQYTHITNMGGSFDIQNGTAECSGSGRSRYAETTIRDLENMNPVPDEDGGNALLVNGNMVSVRRAMNAAPENSVQEGTMEDST